jgi:hypothetical protein
MLKEWQAEVAGPGKFEGEPPIAAYIMGNYSPQDCDEDDSHPGWGWIGRIGKRIIREDSQGFVYLDKFESVSEAQHKFALYTDGWHDEDDDEQY